MIKNNIIYRATRLAFRLLNARQRRGSLFLTVGVIFGALLDVVGLGVIIVLISLAMEPDLIHSNKILVIVYQVFDFQSDKFFLFFVSICVLVVFFMKNLLYFLILHRQAIFAYKLADDLSGRQFINYLAKDLNYIRNEVSARLVTNTVNIPSFFSAGILLPLIVFYSELTVLTIIVIIIAVSKPVLVVLVGLVLGGAFAAIFLPSRNKMAQLNIEKNKYFPEAYGQAAESLRGFVDININNKVNFFLSNFLQKQRKVNDVLMWQYTYNILPSRASETIAVLGIVIVFGYSIFMSSGDKELLQTLMLFAVAAYRTLPSLNKILNVMMVIKRDSYVFEILEDVPAESLTNKAVTPVPLSFEKTIEINSLYYNYPGESTASLNDLSFSIQKGESIGIVGTSGAGKSTFMNLFLRFLIEKNGGIYVDGVKLDEAHLLAWRNLIGYVQQDVFLLDGSITENIAFGLSPEEVDHAKLTRAVQGANLSEFVSTLPEGLNTHIGENGARLSGGQRQRIGIARALYKEASILLLDEATSALDGKNEEEITNAIRDLNKQGITIIIVAHRVTTLRDCNRIIELKEGKFAAEYQYNDILESSLFKQGGGATNANVPDL